MIESENIVPEEIAPFLVSIPMRGTDGKLIYDVDGSTKPIGIARHDTPPEPEPPPLCNLDCKMCYVHLNIEQMRGGCCLLWSSGGV